MSSTKPPWPATAGLIIVSISSWTFCLSSALMASPLHGYFTRKAAEGQLALRGLRSAEPGLGQARRALATGRQHGRGARRRAGQLIGHAPHAAERRRGILTPVGGLGDERRDGPGEPVHPRVRMRPAVVERALRERPEVRREGPVLSQERARRHEEPDRVLYGIDGVDELMALDEVEKIPVVVERRPRRERHPGRARGDAGRADGTKGLDEVRARV